jgi:hypothetical protein
LPRETDGRLGGTTSGDFLLIVKLLEPLAAHS